MKTKIVNFILFVLFLLSRANLIALRFDLRVSELLARADKACEANRLVDAGRIFIEILESQLAVQMRALCAPAQPAADSIPQSGAQALVQAPVTAFARSNTKRFLALCEQLVAVLRLANDRVLSKLEKAQDPQARQLRQDFVGVQERFPVLITQFVTNLSLQDLPLGQNIYTLLERLYSACHRIVCLGLDSINYTSCFSGEKNIELAIRCLEVDAHRVAIILGISGLPEGFTFLESKGALTEELFEHVLDQNPELRLGNLVDSFRLRYCRIFLLQEAVFAINANIHRMEVLGICSSLEPVSRRTVENIQTLTLLMAKNSVAYCKALIDDCQEFLDQPGLGDDLNLQVTDIQEHGDLILLGFFDLARETLNLRESLALVGRGPLEEKKSEEGVPKNQEVPER